MATPSPSPLRPLDGQPLWLPAAATVPILKREAAAYGRDEEARALIETGLYETGRAFVYRCEMCGNVARNDQRMEPMCTGPSWTDDHPPEVMTLVGAAEPAVPRPKRPA